MNMIMRVRDYVLIFFAYITKWIFILYNVIMIPSIILQYFNQMPDTSGSNQSHLNFIYIWLGGVQFLGGIMLLAEFISQYNGGFIQRIKNRKFKKAMKVALADGVLNKEEMQDLTNRANQLNIKDNQINLMREKDFSKRTSHIIEEIKNTRRFSIEDECKLKEIANNLKIDLTIPSEFSIYRKLWEYENFGVFNTDNIESNIILTNNETCYFEAHADWKQIKTVRQRQGYVGTNLSFRVIKGVRFSIGRSVPLTNE